MSITFVVDHIKHLTYQESASTYVSKYVCDTIGKCDGIIKDNNKGYYEVFRLKTKFSEANRHNKSCNIFIKNKFKLGKYL